jgi:hypothetical protein
MENLKGRDHLGKNKTRCESSTESSLEGGRMWFGFIFLRKEFIGGFSVMNIWIPQRIRTYS